MEKLKILFYYIEQQGMEILINLFIIIVEKKE